MTNKYQKMMFEKMGIEKLVVNKWKVALIVFLAYLLMFVSKMPQNITGFGDSDMFVTTGYRLGLMKSPGYAVYTGLLYIFTHLPMLPNPATGAHLLSAVLGSLTLVFVFLTTWEFYGNKRKYYLFSRNTERLILSVVSVCVLSLSSLFWSSSMVAEKFALGGVVLSAFVWIATMKSNDRKVANIKFNALSVLLGLGLSHQLIFVSLVPIYGFVLYKYFGKKELSKVSKYLATMAVTFAGVTSFLWFLDGNRLNLSPIIGEGLIGMWSFLKNGYLTNGTGDYGVAEYFSLSKVIVNLWEFCVVVLKDTYWISILPLIFLGLFIQKNSKFDDRLLVVGMTFVSVLLTTASILVWPESNLDKQLISLNLVYVQIVFVVLVWFGLNEMVGRFGEAGSILFQKKRVDWFNVVLLFLPVIIFGLFVLKKDSLAKFDVAYKLSEEMLNRVEESSIVTCYTYTSCQSLVYMQEVLGMRSDIDLVPFYYQPGLVQISNNNLQGFDYKTFPFVIYDVVTWNLESRKVYAVDIFQEYYDLFGTSFGFMYLVPEGYVGRFEHDLPEKFSSGNFSLSKKIVEDGKSDWKIITDNTTAKIGRMHMFNASIFMKMGLRKEGTEQANLASNIYHLLGEDEGLEVLIIKEGLEKILESKYFVPGTEAQSVDYVVDNIKPLLDAKLTGRALEIAQGAVTLDPRSVKARLAWAEMLLTVKYNDRALEEFENVLRLDPGNKEANDGIERALGKNTESNKPEIFN